MEVSELDSALQAHQRFGDQLESYKSFFDHRWAQRISALTRGTKLDVAVFALCMNWKAAANTHLLPWLIVEMLVKLLHGTMVDMEPLAAVAARELKRRLVGEMKGTLSRAAERRLRKVVDKAVASASTARTSSYAAMKGRFGRPTFWSELLQEREFQLSLWGSQRICYVAIYHAFEDFVRQCVTAASGKPVGWRPEHLVRAARQAFGETFVETCLGDHEVTQARLVRNALSHYGGKITAELTQLGCSLMVEEGVVQIMPADTAHLFDVLKERAYEVAKKTLEVIEMPQSGSGRPPSRP
jgi:hypothetical protein